MQEMTLFYNFNLILLEFNQHAHVSNYILVLSDFIITNN